MRVVRFMRFLVWLFRARLVTRSNVRAVWTQSDPDWLAKLPRIEMTDEEWVTWTEDV